MNMTWSADNPMLDIHGNPTDRHARWVTDASCRHTERAWALEDTIGRLQLRVTALEKIEPFPTPRFTEEQSKEYHDNYWERDGCKPNDC